MAWRRGWGERYYYPPSRPRAAKGGIKAQSQRGTFGASWWAQRWIKVLEGFQIGARLGRGRSYARNGQVLSVAIEKGLVRARVQGSRPQPYDITIQVRTISESDWSALARALARQAVFAAKLLAGEMPQDIEQVFQEVGLTLFPAQLGDLSTKCSCPDWSNPCKHIAAVYYLLGEEFDRDPFLIFALRGLDRDALIERLGEPGPSALSTTRAVPSAPEPLLIEAKSFWGEGFADEPFEPVEIPPQPAALPRRLGHFPFWRGERPLLEDVAPLYAAASPRGLDVFLGQDRAATEPDPGRLTKPSSSTTHHTTPRARS